MRRDSRLAAFPVLAAIGGAGLGRSCQGIGYVPTGGAPRLSDAGRSIVAFLRSGRDSNITPLGLHRASRQRSAFLYSAIKVHLL